MLCARGTNMAWPKQAFTEPGYAVHVTEGRARALLTVVYLWWRRGNVKRIFLSLITQYISNPQESWGALGILDARFSLVWKIILELKNYAWACCPEPVTFWGGKSFCSRAVAGLQPSPVVCGRAVPTPPTTLISAAACLGETSIFPPTCPTLIFAVLHTSKNTVLSQGKV